MKKIVFTTTALFILACSSASALTFQATTISAKDGKGSGTTATPDSSAGTSAVPTCPPNDPKGCGIFD